MISEKTFLRLFNYQKVKVQKEYKLTPKTMTTAKQLGYEAAQIASDHADKINYNWSADAYNLFCDYAKTHDTFTTEQVRLSFPTFHKPPTNRAWGCVALKAQKNGIIKAVGIVPTKNKTAHGANATLWKSQILDVVIKCRMEFEAVYK